MEITTKTIGDSQYIRYNDLAEHIAATKFPNGVQTEQDFMQIARLAHDWIVENGYQQIPKVLSPPHVPFSERGEYHKKIKEEELDQKKAREAIQHLESSHSLYDPIPIRTTLRRIWSIAYSQKYARQRMNVWEKQHGQAWQFLLKHMAERGRYPNEEKTHFVSKPIEWSQEMKDRLTYAISKLPQLKLKSKEIAIPLDEDGLSEAFGRKLAGIDLVRLAEQDEIVRAIFAKRGYMEVRLVRRYEASNADAFFNARGGNAVWAMIKEDLQINKTKPQKMFIAKGHGVYAEQFCIENGEVVVLKILGQPNDVRASWAALVSNQSFYAGGARIVGQGRGKYEIARKYLPCGWMQMVIIHKNASFAHKTTDEPRYLLSTTNEPGKPPEGFCEMLRLATPIPILKEWEEKLWLEGRTRGAVTAVNEVQNINVLPWKINGTVRVWQPIIEGLFEQGEITL